MSFKLIIPFAISVYVQIVYLDFSPTSLATAQSRAEARNLKNILWVILNKVLPIRIHMVRKYHSFPFFVQVIHLKQFFQKDP